MSGDEAPGKGSLTATVKDGQFLLDPVTDKSPRPNNLAFLNANWPTPIPLYRRGTQ